MKPDKVLSRYKRPSEEFRLTWDFLNDVEDGDTATTYSCKAFDADSGVEVTSTFLQAAGRSGNLVSVQVQAGTADHDYLVLFQLGTASGNVFQRVVRVPVRA